MKTSVNNAAFVCIVSRFPTSIVDSFMLSARMRLVIRLAVVTEILSWPLI